MNLPTNNSWNEPQRQAPAGLLIILVKTVTTILRTLWPLLLVAIFRSQKKDPGMMNILFTVLPLLILVVHVLNFYYFRFYIANEELILKRGFFVRKTLAIPLGRIQAVHLEQSWLHQLVSIMKVRIDTAGSEKTEATIDALSIEKAEQLKSYLLEEKLQAQPAGGEGERAVNENLPLRTLPEKAIIRLSISDVLKLGISANHIKTFFLVLAFSISLFNNLEEVFGDRIIQTLEQSSTTIGRSMAALAMLAAFVLMLSIVVSLVRIALKYFDFTLSETFQGYKLKAGLINTRQNLIPFSKIQFVSWDANWIRRKIRLYNFKFHQAGSEENEARRKQQVSVPVTQQALLEKLLQQYHVPVQPVAHSEHGIHRVYPFRRSLLHGVLPVAVLLLAGWLYGWQLWMCWVMLWIPYVFFNALVFRKNFRLYVAPDAFQLNSGIWGRETKIVKWYKIQQLSLDQSLYQRSKGLASLHMRTAGGTLNIPYIPLALAEKIRDYALYEVERLDRSWM